MGLINDKSLNTAFVVSQKINNPVINERKEKIKKLIETTFNILDDSYVESFEVDKNKLIADAMILLDEVLELLKNDG